MLIKKLLTILLIVPGISFSATCNGLHEYSVDGINFVNQTSTQALSKLMSSTPYKVNFKGVPPKSLINAEDIAGPLNEIIDEFSQELNLEYSVSDCILTISSRASALEISVGDRVDLSIQRWLQNNGYTLTWDAPKVIAGGNLVENKSIEDSLQTVVDFMKSNGINIEVGIYENNAIRVLEVK